MKQIFGWFLFGILFSLSGCTGESSQYADTDTSTGDNDLFPSDDEQGEETDDDDPFLYNDDGLRLPLCDPPCNEDEVCNPYGECICDSRKWFVGKYQGKCINGGEANKIFCNDHGLNYTARASFWKGGMLVLSKESDLLCALCQPGWFGERCDVPLDDYADELPEGGYPNNPGGFRPVKPYCENNADCTEGLICNDKGYCMCEGNISFKDAGFESDVRQNLGIDAATPITGEMLTNMNSFLTDQAKNLEDLRCMPNLRELYLTMAQNLSSLEPIKGLKHLQGFLLWGMDLSHLDLSPVTELDRLLRFHLAAIYGLPGSDTTFLRKMKSKKSMVHLFLNFGKILFPVDLSFLQDYENLALLQLIFRGDQETMRPTPLSLLPYPEKLQSLGMEGRNIQIDDPTVFLRMANLVSLVILEPGSNIGLSQFSYNEKLINLTMEGDMMDIPVRERFPNTTFVSMRNAVEKLDEKIAGLDMGSLIYSSEFDTKPLFPAGIYAQALSDMNNLNTVYFSPYYDIADIGWLKDKKYLSTVLLQPWCGEDCFPHDWDYPRNNSVYQDLLYLVDCTDYMGGVRSLDDFVTNCKNGGSLCRKDDYLAYIQMPSGDLDMGRVLYFLNNPIDPDTEENNLQFLSKYRVSVELEAEIAKKRVSLRQENFSSDELFHVDTFFSDPWPQSVGKADHSAKVIETISSVTR